MNAIPLNKMPIANLRKTVSALSSKDTSTWPKSKCIQWLIENCIHEINVGNFCRVLLRAVVEKNKDGFPVGLSFTKMVQIAKNHFPYSAVNDRHFSWYATRMRAEGEMIPVYRERSK